MTEQLQPQPLTIQGNAEIINQPSPSSLDLSSYTKSLPFLSEQPQTPPVNQQPPSGEYNLLVSHNNRIQSWLDPLLKTNPTFLAIFQKNGKMRYSNGAALSLEFENDKVVIKMVNPGDATSNKTKHGEPYWGIQDDAVKHITKFQNLDISMDVFLQTLKIANRESVRNLIGQKFLIVRHGQAKHNDVKFVNLDYDTLLTSKGIEQAKKLGIDLKQSGMKISKECYVSDLIRTGMTAWAIGKELFGESSFEQYIVVPCNTEVKDEGGDKTNSNIPMVRNENKTDCKFTKSCLTAKPIPNCSICSRCFYIDKYGTPKKCPLDSKGLIQKGYQAGAIDLTPKYIFTYYMDFVRNESKCHDDFFQQLNIVFSGNSRMAPPSANQLPVAAAAGGSKYKKTKKLKRGKKFTKKGGKKNKARKTSKK